MLALCMVGLLVPAAGLRAQEDFLKAPRDAFAKAYTQMDYAGICAILHPDASFRGSLNPAHWSHTADNIVKERWNVNQDCDCKNVAQCKPSTSTPAPATQST